MNNQTPAGQWLASLDALLLTVKDISMITLTPKDKELIARHLQGARKVILNRFYN